MAKIIHISGQIGHTLNPDGSIAVQGVTVADVAVPLAAAAGEPVEVYITSPGGSVSVGDLISELLAKTPNVYTVAVGQCASIATKIFTSVPVENRSIVEGCDFMVHNPLFANISGNAAELKFAAELLEPLEKDLTQHYVKATGQKKEIIAPLMSAESHLTADECVQLGFAGKKIEALQAVAFFDNQEQSNTNTIMSNLEAFKTRALALAVELGIVAPEAGAGGQGGNGPEGREAVAMVLESDKGSIETPYSDLMVGDPVVLADTQEVAPDDTYTMPDGMKVVVKDGMVSELIPVEGGDMAAMIVAKDAEIESLKAQVAEYEALNETTEKVIEKLQAKAVVSTYKPQVGAVAHFRQETAKTTTKITKEEMAARRQSYGK